MIPDFANQLHQIDPKDPNAVAKLFLEAVGPVAYHAGGWYRYRDGVYIAADGVEIDADVRALLSRCVPEKQTEPFRPLKRHVGEVTAALRDRSVIPRAARVPCWRDGQKGNDFLVLANEVLDLATFSVSPHDPQLFALMKANIAYRADAPLPHSFLDFLERSLATPQTVELVQEMMGYFLTTDTRFQAIFCLAGPSGSGKGTLTRLLQHLLGAESVCNPVLSQAQGRFFLSSLRNRKLAICNEIDGLRDNRGHILRTLLALSGEDTLDADVKNKDYAALTPGLRFLLVGLHEPSFGRSNPAWLRRKIVIRTRLRQDPKDPALEDRLVMELPGILNWALEGLRRLRVQGGFTGHMYDPGQSVDLIQRFADEYLTVDPGAVVRPNELTAAAAEFARKNGIPPWPSPMLFERLGSIFGARLQKVRPRVKTENGQSKPGTRIVRGIGLKGGLHDDPPDPA
jgi:putative DNA primase/helicase